MLGDVGGTNIRLELVEIQPPHNQPVKQYKKQTLKVEKHEKLVDAIKEFLVGVEKYP